jgi:hypothetical protein
MRKLLVLALLSVGLVWVFGNVPCVADAVEATAPVAADLQAWQAPDDSFMAAVAVKSNFCPDRDPEPVRFPVDDAGSVCIAPSTMCYPGQKENRDISTGCCYFTCSNQCEYVLTAFTQGTPCP